MTTMRSPRSPRKRPGARPLRGLALACALLAGCGSDGDSASSEPPKDALGPKPDAPLVAAQTGAQRLSTLQYAASLRFAFGDDVVVPPALEPDAAQDGFVSVGSSYTTISPRGVEQYEKGSYDVAAQVVGQEARRKASLPCTPSGATDETCFRSIAKVVGRRLFRRQLDETETSALVQVALKAASALSDPLQGVTYELAALMQSPSFLFRVSVGEPDPAHPGKRRYTSSEMASRLSFFLWNGPPDDELLDAADLGALTTDAGLAQQAQRMLASPKARAGLRNFVSEWLDLGRLDTLSKDPMIFTSYTPDIGKYMREETLHVFERLVFDDEADYRGVFVSQKTWVNPKLAALYQIAAPNPDGFGEVTLPDDGPRRGLLGHAGILALYAHPVSSSATLRGKFVRATLLCGGIPPPPVNVNTALPEPSATAITLRERIKPHLDVAACAACHKRMDPIGLGLENFDGLGRYRVKESTAVIDPSGDLDGVPFADGKELGKVVSEHPDVLSCLTRKMYRYATGFAELPEEEATLTELTWELRAANARVKPLMLAMVMSSGFRLSGDPR